MVSQQGLQEELNTNFGYQVLLPDIHQAQNRVRYAMNNFVISVGTYIPSLTDKSVEIAKSIGKVSVDMGGTSCKVPFAPEYIEKVVAKGFVGKKRKAVRC